MENLKGRDHLEDQGVDGKITMDLGEINGRVWTEFIWK
jgi:hypothetical protein